MTGAIVGHILRSVAAGMLVVLPIVLTVLIITWSANLILELTGPGSVIGGILSAVGLVLVSGQLSAYLVGTLVVLLALYLLGQFVTLRLYRHVGIVLDRTIVRVPLVGSIYRLTNRFVGLLDRSDDANLKSMSPVWCFLGGETGPVVLALMPTAEPLEIEGRTYRVILIPSAPVPVGGGLVFVPAEWIRPAAFGIEGLANIYISMGATASQFVKSPTAGASTEQSAR
ncbi:DUF502 domain-containing protein [Mesorhizobium sp. L-8-3]|uniref:DUF502 domain-containing protein n=1 Tax=Mesorhizobium sp. L-8-3 TaxID=2744522 RepID=UPI0019264E9A|nr:DUF502 domain-containing protein [Mesorhizobium sp. L-8-3]BCH24561.1 hypothetical protein MesoLjLb_43460 [Mesorhizobium sp. L-8-3]